MPLSNVFNMDCIKGMAGFPDGFFDLAIADPPYGINITKQGLGEGGGLYRQPKSYKRGDWDGNAPTPEYFEELRRVSKNQIIWGGNYFDLPPTLCYIFWDKNNGASDFADGELAWTSFKSPVRKFKYTWSGPTQKPAALYTWCLQKYAHPGNKILDTHMGSQSSRIAAYNSGFDYWGYELDEDYFNQGNKRFKEQTAQLPLF